VTSRPLILITNDDGVLSPGLHAAAEAVIDLGDVLIVAPATGQTSMSRAFTSGPDVGAVVPVEIEIAGRSVTAYGVMGSPALAVAHAMLELVDRTPALCVSGVNYGENIGGGLSVSGTLGAAMHAVSLGIPGLAVSLQVDMDDWHANDERDWAAAMHFTRQLAAKILAEGLPDPVSVINLNIPSDASEITEMRRTHQSRLSHYLHVHPGERDLATPVRLRHALNLAEEQVEADSDVRAIMFDRVVSVTPLSWSMTADTTWRP